jgi:mitogen-activated protein kinase kinase kinase
MNSPSTTSPAHKHPPRPPANNNNSLPFPSQPSVHGASGLHNNLSPIAESFASPSTATPPSFVVGRGPFKPQNNSSHNSAPSLDDLRRSIITVHLADAGHSCKIAVLDCAGGVEVMEKALKKFGKFRSGKSPEDDNSLDHVEVDNGRLLVDGWGVFVQDNNGEREYAGSTIWKRSLTSTVSEISIRIGTFGHLPLSSQRLDS